jgi:hypothetical protein
MASDYVRRLERYEVWSNEAGAFNLGRHPTAIGTTVKQQRDKSRSITDNPRAHRRSASRAARIDAASTRSPVASTRARARAITSSTGGREAASRSIPRRYSCNDFPALAARAASSLRISSGTSRTVIATLIACNLAAFAASCSSITRYQPHASLDGGHIAAIVIHFQRYNFAWPHKSLARQPIPTNPSNGNRR